MRGERKEEGWWLGRFLREFLGLMFGGSGGLGLAVFGGLAWMANFFGVGVGVARFLIGFVG
jgi:hypothetical protein